MRTWMHARIKFSFHTIVFTQHMQRCFQFKCYYIHFSQIVLRVCTLVLFIVAVVVLVVVAVVVVAAVSSGSGSGSSNGFVLAVVVVVVLVVVAVVVVAAVSSGSSSGSSNGFVLAVVVVVVLVMVLVIFLFLCVYFNQLLDWATQKSGPKDRLITFYHLADR